MLSLNSTTSWRPTSESIGETLFKSLQVDRRKTNEPENYKPFSIKPPNYFINYKTIAHSWVKGSKLRPWLWVLPKIYGGGRMYSCIHSARVLDQNHTYQWWKHFLNSVTVPVECLHLLWSPSSSQTPVLRHEGGLYSVPSSFHHCYCCQRCHGNRVSFDRVFRNFLIINIHAMWWSGSYLSLQARDMHCGCNKMTHTEAWGDHRASSLVIRLYSKGAGQDKTHGQKREFRPLTPGRLWPEDMPQFQRLVFFNNQPGKGWGKVL